MNLTPIQTQVRLGGISAVLSTPAVQGTAGGYDPTSEIDFTPSDPQTQTVRGVYHDGHLTGADEHFTGVFTIQASSKPAWLQPNVSSLVLNGNTRQIGAIRERFHIRKVDGYDLFLSS